MSGRTPLVAAVSGAAIAISGLLAPISSLPAHAADPAPRTVTLVGDLQSELGCPGDWQPDCTTTDLTQVGGSTAYERVFDVPAGTWQLKVAINHSWDESYGADGGASNIPLVLQGPAKVEFSYDDATHQVGIAPTDLPGPATKADQALAKD